MRAARLAPFVLAAAPACGFAQSAPFVATVSESEVKLRAGPSDKYPETGTLPRGSRVTVDHEEPAGWLAIAAPHTAVSWVPAQFLSGFDPAKPLPQNAVVQGEGEVTLAAGQVGVPQPLEIRRVKVPDGTILVVVGAKAVFQNKTWFPVVPPDGDFRYVPRTAVRSVGAADNTFVVTGGSTAKPNLPAAAGVPAALPTAAGMADAPRAGGVSHPLWAQAEQAELAGRLDDAEKLFFELARIMNEPGGDHDVANQCYTRIHTLREKKRLNLASGPASAAAASGTWIPSPAGRAGDDRRPHRRCADRQRPRGAAAAGRRFPRPGRSQGRQVVRRRLPGPHRLRPRRQAHLRPGADAAVGPLLRGGGAGRGPGQVRQPQGGPVRHGDEPAGPAAAVHARDAGGDG